MSTTRGKECGSVLLQCSSDDVSGEERDRSWRQAHGSSASTSGDKGS